MWFKALKKEESKTAPEKLGYSRYYEHDGALRAYANRAMMLAFLCVPTTLLAVALATYVRLQPPTVIRIDADGNAAALERTPRAPLKTRVVVAQEEDSKPTDFEKRAFIRSFLERYLNFSPDSVNRNWAESLNLMTANLRRATLSAMTKDDIAGKIRDGQVTSVFHLRSIERQADNPLSYTAFGVKEIHRVRDHQEVSDKMVGEYHIRLISEERSEPNPSGLLIAEYLEKLIDGEKKETVSQSTKLANPN